ncbi:MAG: FtsQ-type POTRA domain-containing protein [Deltaproteobacteria bacterium]|nr:FtsQ-type POTRA domain-containing protein [Deltaproteobacteria bacterium]
MARVAGEPMIRSARHRQRRWLRIARRVERISRVVLVWLLGVGALYGIYALICERDLFAVRQIVVSGDFTHLDEASIKELTEVELGTSLFQLSLDAVQERVNRHPWVRASAVRRKLPHILWIYVVEREPIALLNANGLYLVDAEAKIFKAHQVGDPSDLPILTGITDVTVDGNGVGHSTQLEGLLQLERRFERHALAERLGISELVRDRYGRISVITERPAIQLRLGEQPSVEQLDRFVEIWPALEPASSAMQSVDLFVERKVVVRSDSS